MRVPTVSGDEVVCGAGTRDPHKPTSVRVWLTDEEILGTWG